MYGGNTEPAAPNLGGMVKPLSYADMACLQDGGTREMRYGRLKHTDSPSKPQPPTPLEADWGGGNVPSDRDSWYFLWELIRPTMRKLRVPGECRGARQNDTKHTQPSKLQIPLRSHP
ncbi:hypothetical protein DPEC_G00028790 [Dallia pectoralis]|uniref:Uncharacterized protein n=1 Tax=Dallia pectoralis TaxID=75939 RepID=A0ACC2HIZ2_DALPE|nr:hypothetical protein DPEC_G00028790 [Dallia pectoralis]